MSQYNDIFLISQNTQFSRGEQNFLNTTKQILFDNEMQSGKIGALFSEQLLDDHAGQSTNLGKRKFSEFKDDSDRLISQYIQEMNDENFFYTIPSYPLNNLPNTETINEMSYEIPLNDRFFEISDENQLLDTEENQQENYSIIPESRKKLIHRYLVDGERMPVKNAALRIIEALDTEKKFPDEKEAKKLLRNGFRLYILKQNVSSIRNFLKKNPFNPEFSSSIIEEKVENFIFKKKIKSRNRNSKLELSEKEKNAFYNLMLAYPLLTATQFAQKLIPEYKAFFSKLKRINEKKKCIEANPSQEIRDFIYSAWCVSMPSLKKSELRIFVLNDEEKKQYIKVVLPAIERTFPYVFQALRQDF